MDLTSLSLPSLFKGIALFTPGGDLVYCIDPSKQARWHLQLCAALQEILSLPEVPHFLVPCYTATFDRWLDPKTQTVRQSAGAYPPTLRYQSLLNAVFGTEGLVWQPVSDAKEVCHPLIIAAHYEQFFQLWENHDLVICLQDLDTHSFRKQKVTSQAQPLPREGSLSMPIETPKTQGYVLRLFVSGHNLAAERTLKTLHQLLEQLDHHPYTLKVIDVLKHPEQAEADQISATPTLIKVWPRPVRRIIGEISDLDTLLRLLVSVEDLLIDE
ncbi:MAG: circadian clock KaiB family protein [Microcoleaceae cyanobacterium]